MSSPSAIVFSIIKTHDGNKNLEKDEHGYYKVTLGGLNTYNSAGEYYIADGVKELVETPSSMLCRRLKAGYLNGEMGHPSLQPGMSKTDYYIRNMKIEQSNISHHIKQIEFVPDPKSNFIRIMGWVKPAGPHGALLQQALDNPDQNVAFSIRSFTDNTYTQTGKVIKQIKEIITWDWVLEPGIKEANSWNTLSMESLDLCKISVEDIALIKEKLTSGSIGNEESGIIESLNNLNGIVTRKTNTNDMFNKW